MASSADAATLVVSMRNADTEAADHAPEREADEAVGFGASSRVDASKVSAAAPSGSRVVTSAKRCQPKSSAKLRAASSSEVSDEGSALNTLPTAVLNARAPTIVAAPPPPSAAAVATGAPTMGACRIGTPASSTDAGSTLVGAQVEVTSTAVDAGAAATSEAIEAASADESEHAGDETVKAVVAIVAIGELARCASAASLASHALKAVLLTTENGMVAAASPITSTLCADTRSQRNARVANSTTRRWRSDMLTGL